MILTEVYLGLNGEWVDVSDLTVYPIEEILTLDETLDYGTMTIYTDQEDEYPRNTVIKLVKKDVDEETKAETYRETSFYLGNDVSTQYSFGNLWNPLYKRACNLFKHDFRMIEPTEILKGYFVNGKACTQPIEGNGKSVDQFIDDILATTPFRLVTTPQRFTLDEGIRAKIRAAGYLEFAYNSRMTLLEVLSDVGKSFCGIPRLKASNPDGLPAPKFFDIITFDFYDEFGEELDEIPYSGVKSTANEEWYNTALECSADNLMVSEPVTIENLRLQTDELRLTEDEAYVPTFGNIQKILKVKMMKEGNWTLGIGASIFEVFGYNAFDITKYVLEESDWKALPLNEQENKLYYSKGENKIKGFGKKYKNFLFFGTPVWKSLLKTVFNENTISGIYFDKDDNNIWKTGTTSDVYFPNFADFDTFYFSVEYIPMPATAIIQSRKYLDSEQKTVAYNQSTELASTEKLGKDMWTSCQRLGNRERLYLVRYKNYQPLHKIGDTRGDFVLTAVKKTLTSMFSVEAVYTFSKDYMRISEHVGVDKEFRFDPIPAEFVERKINIPILANISDKYIDEENCGEVIFPFRAEEFKRLRIVISPDVGKFLLPTNIAVCGKSFVVFASTYDNRTLGKKRVGDLNKSIIYTDDNGEIGKMKIILALGDGVGVAQGNYPIVSNLPLRYAFEREFAVQKDARERLHFTFQIHYVSDSGIIIGEALTAAFSETSPSQKRVVLLSKKISKFSQNLKSSEIIECEAKATFDLRNIKLSGLPHNGSGWAIVDEKNRIYLAESKSISEIKTNENGDRMLYCNLTIS